MRIYEFDQPPVIQWSSKVHRGDKLVMINTQKVHDSWAKDTNFYFDGADHPNAIKGRISRFDAWVKNGIPVEAPEVNINHAGDIVFSNGRHRFTWMVQHGVEHMPVAVPEEHADEIAQRYGV